MNEKPMAGRKFIIVQDDQAGFRLKSKILFSKADWNVEFKSTETIEETIALYESLNTESIDAIFLTISSDGVTCTGVELGHALRKRGYKGHLYITATTRGKEPYSGSIKELQGLTGFEAARKADFNGWCSKTDSDLASTLEIVKLRVEFDIRNFTFIP